MRKLRPCIAAVVLLTATVAAAQSPVFRQRIREVNGCWRAGLNDDGTVAFETDCHANEQATTDGGTWPLKFTGSVADGGNPTQVLRACVGAIERRNGLDGGVL